MFLELKLGQEHQFEDEIEPEIPFNPVLVLNFSLDGPKNGKFRKSLNPVGLTPPSWLNTIGPVPRNFSQKLEKGPKPPAQMDIRNWTGLKINMKFSLNVSKLYFKFLIVRFFQFDKQIVIIFPTSYFHWLPYFLSMVQ